MADFAETIAKAYATDGPALELGQGVHDGALAHDAVVKLPLKMTNRHGLIAGATGTGKTRTLQVLAEQLSAAGVPVFLADVKGDVSGMADPGDPASPAGKRAADLGIEFAPTGFPTEYLALGGIGPGIPVRATVSDFGPQLLAKVLQANDTQEQSLGLVFRYADDKKLPLLDLSDLRALLTFLDSDEGKGELVGIGGLASQTVGVLLRALVSLEDGGGTEFFGEPQFEIPDLLRTAPDGRGVVTCLELPAVQDKPKLFSTALMWMLAELFEELPEVGDLDKPKLVFFFDEAHLLFDGATKAFVQSVTQTVRLIRSKGVGVFFITQVPKDIHEDVLAQLGNRVQHALRAFTPDDAEALKQAVKTYPKSGFYDMEQLLTQLGTGEAAVTILSESGVPTPVVHTRLRPPLSRMGPTDNVDKAAKASSLYAKYGERKDSESAREMLAARMEKPSQPSQAPPPSQEHRQAARASKAEADPRRLPQVVGRSPGRARDRARSLRHAQEAAGIGSGQVPHRTRPEEVPLIARVTTFKGKPDRLSELVWKLDHIRSQLAGVSGLLSSYTAWNDDGEGVTYSVYESAEAAAAAQPAIGNIWAGLADLSRLRPGAARSETSKYGRLTSGRASGGAATAGDLSVPPPGPAVTGSRRSCARS